MTNLFYILLIGFLIYAVYIIIKIYKLKSEVKQLKSEYIEKGGLTEEQKIAKEEELENQRISDLINPIIANNDKQEKYRLISDIYTNVLGDDEIKIKYFESELNKLAPEILKTNILHKLFHIFLRVLGGFALLTLWGAFMVVTGTNSGSGPAISGIVLGAFIVRNPWIKAWINPFGLKNAERFRFGKKRW